MSIIFSSNGDKAVRVDKSAIDQETYLQQYIYDNPESIPLYEIKEDIQLLILAREFGTNSGPIDAIGIDRYGELYIVETKLFKNPDKRLVISQALDYGAALWKHANDFTEFKLVLDRHTQKVFGQNSTEKVSEFFSLEAEEVSALFEKAKDNLNDGKFHFVVLMDKLDDRLKDLILYVNQNSQFDIYAVEFSYYRHAEHEIIIPRIFGTEVKKDISVQSSSRRQQWTEATLIQTAEADLKAEELQAFNKLFSFTKEYANEIRLGTGSYPSFSAIFPQLSAKSIFTVTIDDKFRLSFNFEWIARDNDQTAQLLYSKLQSIGFVFPDNYREIRPSVYGEDWVSKTDDLISLLREMLAM